MTAPHTTDKVGEAQNQRREALIERLDTVADLACQTPIAGDLGDVAYDLLRQAAAQIASDRLLLAALASSRAEGKGNPYPEQVEKVERVARAIHVVLNREDMPEGGWTALMQEAAFAALAALNTPISMILHCPRCHVQHVDEATPEWSNPPHQSHLCLACGCIWRPADVPTQGVERILTVGKADTNLASLANRPADDGERKHCNLPCGYDCNHPDGCLVVPPQPEGVKRP